MAKLIPFPNQQAEEDAEVPATEINKGTLFPNISNNPKAPNFDGTLHTQCPSCNIVTPWQAGEWEYQSSKSGRPYRRLSLRRKTSQSKKTG